MTKARSIEEFRVDYPNAYKKWSIEEDELLETFFNEGKSIKEICPILKRTSGAISSRIRKKIKRRK